MFKGTKDQITKYARRYDECAKAKPQDKIIEEEMKDLLDKRGKQKWIGKDELIKIADWKAPGRIRHLCDKNEREEIKNITRKALAVNTDHRARTDHLLKLHGVRYPMASVILHFAFPHEYPILDRRAIWSLRGEKQLKDSFKDWDKYCKKILDIVKSTGCKIREIDKALWQYSRENQ